MTTYRTVIKVVPTMALGLLLAIIAVAQVATAAPGEGPHRTEPSQSPEHAVTYARVVTGNVPLYRNPADLAGGVAPVRSLAVGYLYVSLADTRPITQAGQTWYKVNRDEYVQARYIALARPSRFQGIALEAHPDKPFGWMVFATRPSPKPGAAPARDAPRLARYTPVTVHEEKRVGDWTWYRIRDNQWIEQRTVSIVQPSARPEGVGATDRWIEVSLFEQTLAAYEGDRMVYATLVSSGLPQWSTREGLFRVWAKARKTDMDGRDGYSDYYSLEDVPWTMFFDKEIALHGAYWHDGFGFRHSHGCVNLPPADARWLYDWTAPGGDKSWVLPTQENPGTVVWVHQ